LTSADLKAHIETIERSYEFFLSYAALGATDDAAAKMGGGQLREFLSQMENALSALETDLESLLDTGYEPVSAYRDMIEITSRDAAKAGAKVRLVSAQSTISSQLIDNLNASTHLRAVLTDLFLLDDVI
jgi:hypothetical protein